VVFRSRCACLQEAIRRTHVAVICVQLSDVDHQSLAVLLAMLLPGGFPPLK